ncbi:N-acetyltransferase [Gammaproteobacteria bacterium LSUCC0112]|nr:N-acetyltransferase [Gammaproteobacteria bacterium LSUCC0112]
MRESLTHIGRFDADRARERFVVSFNPDYTRFINVGGVRVGFVVVKPDVSRLILDHLYIEPEFQRRGIGGRVLQSIFATADRLGLPMFVTALRGSDSNTFYQRHGFKYIDETEWDINYSRMPAMH